MANYVYPAVFKKEENGQYSISFPDIPGCFSMGEDMKNGLYMAKDALCLMLYDKEESGEAIPAVSDPASIKVNTDEFVTLVECDTLEYRKFFNNKAIKKTLTIPAWLNEMAEREAVNYSAILQQALKDHLHVEK